MVSGDITHLSEEHWMKAIVFSELGGGPEVLSLADVPSRRYGRAWRCSRSTRSA
jgi:hypothetical protein